MNDVFAAYKKIKIANPTLLVTNDVRETKTAYYFAFKEGDVLYNFKCDKADLNITKVKSLKGKNLGLPKYKFNKGDVRGVWISTVANIDIPKGLPKVDLKKHLVGILDTMKSYNMNTAIFQVRPTNDALYESALNPWSRFLTGEEGKNPGFDVLAFFIKEAKKRGIKVHAWMNPYRVTLKSVNDDGITKEELLQTLSSNNWARLHPEHTILDGLGKIILSPSHKEVIDFVRDSILEVAEKYDVEGVHIDDYFYPYAKIKEEDEMPDFERRENKNQSFDDWRRENVDKMIKAIHLGLKELEARTGKKVEFGISPFAIYRTHSAIKEGGWDKGSFNSPGALQCYSELYSDVYLWMKEKWIDYVVPQNYFSFGRSDASYRDIAIWWDDIAKETGIKFYMGQAIYRVGEANGSDAATWASDEEIPNQLRFNQNFKTCCGVIFFTYKDLVKGRNEIKDSTLDKLKVMWHGK